MIGNVPVKLMSLTIERLDYHVLLNLNVPCTIMCTIHCTYVKGCIQYNNTYKGHEVNPSVLFSSIRKTENLRISDHII